MLCWCGPARSDDGSAARAMLRGRFALASLCLSLSCVLGLKSPCTRDLDRKVQSFKDKAPASESLNCRLYTPTIEDYQQKCPSSTFRCFAHELKVLIEEWDTASVPRVHGSTLNLKLEKVAILLNQTNEASECLHCELLKEEEAGTFLENLQSTIWMMNSEYCSQKRPLKDTP